LEAVGVGLIYPLLQYISHQGDVAVLTKQSGLWRALVSFADTTGIPVNQLTLSAAVFAMIGLRQFASYWDVVLESRAKQKAEKRLSDRCFRAVLASKASHILSVGSGGFVEIIYGQCPGAAALLRAYANSLSLALTFLSYGVVMLIASPAVSLIGIATVTLVVALATRNARKAKRLSLEKAGIMNGFSQFLSERYGSWKLIKLSNNERYESEREQRWTNMIVANNDRIVRATNLGLLFIAPAIVLFLLVMIYVAVNLFGLTVAELSLFVLVLLRLLPTAQQAARLRQSITVQLGSLERVNAAIRAAESAYEAEAGNADFLGIEDAIVFRDVAFSYRDDALPALNGVSCRIPARRITAIVGPSGAGKSTLVDLLPRLIEPSSGQIQFDDVPLAEFALPSLRRAIAYVPQQPILFDGTIAENVRYVRPQAPQEDIAEACRLAGADEFIERMPGGYETRVGENGHRLSGGQRQRIAIARAFLADVRVVVLDEPTSSLDMASERAIRIALENMVRCRSATVIVIAHRPSTVETAGHIIGLKNGKVVAEYEAGEIGEDRFIALMTGGEQAHELAPLGAVSGG
jgi:ABC-type multidrug transport system fused ATPase/permease subunit